MLDIDYSPIKGPEGNIEYLIHLKKSEQPQIADDVRKKTSQVVEEAFETLAK